MIDPTTSTSDMSTHITPQDPLERGTSPAAEAPVRRPGPLDAHGLDPLALFSGIAFTAIGVILGLDRADSGALVGAALLAAGAIGLLAVIAGQFRRD